jgi:hypothetical protein
MLLIARQAVLHASVPGQLIVQYLTPTLQRATSVQESLIGDP